MSITVEEAAELVLNNSPEAETCSLGLSAAAGLILAEDIRADISQPPFNRSPLDGFTMAASDTKGAGKNNPVRLKIAFTTFAGQKSEREILPGECARITTGAMLPSGADCVVRQEDTDSDGEYVSIYSEVRQWENFVFKGEDFSEGETLLSSGTEMSPAAVAVAASAGYDSVTVYKKPTVAVIATGDEIVEPGLPLPAGKIYDSNQSYASCRMRELGADVVYASKAGDDIQSIADGISSAAGKAQIIITTGGVSVGQKDLIPAVLEELGAEIIFRGVRMKPGMPTLFAKYKNSLIFGLSGNPFAAAVALELLCVPLIKKLEGRDPEPGRAVSVLRNPFEKSSKGRRFIRARLTEEGVFLPEGHSNGQLRSLVGCNCLVDVPAGTGPLKEGAEVTVIKL